jgi:hypothetical protein
MRARSGALVDGGMMLGVNETAGSKDEVAAMPAERKARTRRC